MCLVIARWDDRAGEVASEGREMRLSSAPVVFGPSKTVASEDTFKVHRLKSSLVVGIVGWSHVTDELLAALRAELTTYDEQIVTAHMVRLKQKYPATALQAVLMGVQDSKVTAAFWTDADPTQCYSPKFPSNRRVIVLADPDIAGDALSLARRNTPLNTVFETLAGKYNTINSNVRVEGISL